MYIYNYHPLTNEYTGRSEASIDPVASQREGCNVYYTPAYATFQEPPTLPQFKVAVFKNDQWFIENDYRDEYICDKDLNVNIVKQIGDLPAGTIHITQQQAQKIQQDYLFYIVQDNQLIENPNYEQQKQQQERERIARLAITKYDFFKYICQPNNITYQELMQLVNSNDTIAAAWNLCERIYRGNELLNAYISEFFPDITSEQLDEVFERFGK